MGYRVDFGGGRGRLTLSDAQLNKFKWEHQARDRIQELRDALGEHAYRRGWFEKSRLRRLLRRPSADIRPVARLVTEPGRTDGLGFLTAGASPLVVNFTVARLPDH